MDQNTHSKPKSKITIREIVIFAMLGALMFLSKLLMDGLPNIHMIGVLVVAITIVYRAKALIPIYVFVFITGLVNGFNVWWIPYLYIWDFLWLFTMLVPRSLPDKAKPFVYAGVCALHGLLYGTLYSPFQAIVFGYSFKTTLAWIAAGLPWDGIQAAGNLVLGCLIIPIVKAIELAERTANRGREK